VGGCDYIRGGNQSNKLVNVGVFQQHTEDVIFVTDIDDNKIVTVSQVQLELKRDVTVRVWNKTTCESLETLSLSSEFSSVFKTRDRATLLFGFENGSFDFRRTSDLQIVVKTIQLPRDEYGYDVLIIYCELLDGTFILHYENELQRWDFSTQTLLQTFTGHYEDILEVIELNRDTIVSASKGKTIIWRVSTGELLRKISLDGVAVGLVKLSEGFFAIGVRGYRIDINEIIKLWNERGHNYANYEAYYDVQHMIKLADGSIVTYADEDDSDEPKLRLWKQLSSLSLFFSLVVLSICCT